MEHARPLYAPHITQDVTHTFVQVQAKILCPNPKPVCVVSSLWTDPIH